MSLGHTKVGKPVDLNMSFITQRNKIGPKVLQCSMDTVIFLAVNLSPFISTTLLLMLKQLLNHSSNTPSLPSLDSFLVICREILRQRLFSN